MSATVCVDLGKLRRNAQALTALCGNSGINLAFVTKVFCADPVIVGALDKAADFTYLADSRLDNIARYPKTNKQKLLLRLPAPSEIPRTVELCDASAHSELTTLKLLAAAAQAQNKIHGVLLMVDMGDLREGIFFQNMDAILETARFIQDHPALNLVGVGTNLTCFASILPTADNLSALCAIAQTIERQLHTAPLLVSGGNSSSIYLLPRGEMPSGISNLRLGEAWMRGVEAAYNQPFAGLETNAVTLQAEIIELQQKPSVPVGNPGVTTFGESPVFRDKGPQKRAILAIGRQDVDHTGLFPLDADIEILGASSDHMILDVTHCAQPYALGDNISFNMSYIAILRAFTSSFVARRYLES